ncbi:unnamed protein product, partial [Allacma fusca]
RNAKPAVIIEVLAKILTRVGSTSDYVKTVALGIPVQLHSRYKNVLEYHGKTGMPFPYHADWYDYYQRHYEKMSFRSVGNGNKAHLEYSDDYDSCILASKSVFAQHFRDDISFVSNKVCKIPERVRCEADGNKNSLIEYENVNFGYVVIVLSLAAVFISTACFDIVEILSCD